MNTATNIFITLSAFISMEATAWFTHKYIMHGFLWSLHKDHHQKDEEGFFERNDIFFIFFALPGIILMWIGVETYNYHFWMGLGIALYGFTYFSVHDIFIHQRFKFLRNANNMYFKAIRRAHKIHHKHLNRKNGECFGMLVVPFKYFKEAKTK